MTCWAVVYHCCFLCSTSKAKIMCSSICKCIGCKNFEESPERKTLMHLADAAEVRVQQQTAAKTKLSSQISDLLMRTTPVISSGGGRYRNTFVLQQQEVTSATHLIIYLVILTVEFPEKDHLNFPFHIQ